MESPTAPPKIYPRISFEGKIHLILNDQDLARFLPELLAAQLLGFDTETRPSFKKGQIYKVALLQLSTEKDAYLIRLHGISQFGGLKQIFEKEATIKVGVAIRDDLKNLQKLFGFMPKSFVELQSLAKENGLKNFGLKGMTEEVLESTLNKDPKTTNWENYSLTDKQLLYAATDAWIGLKLYQAIISMKRDAQ